MRKVPSAIGIALWGVAYAIPVGILLLAIFVYGIDVWHYERWTALPLIHDMLREPSIGTLLHSFDTDYHRHAVIRMVQFALVIFTDWNMRIALFIAPVLTMGTIALVHSTSMKTFGRNRQTEVAALGFVSIALLCSLTQWEGWTRAFYDVYFSTLFFSAAAWLLAHKYRNYRLLLLGAGCAFFSSFSFSSGYFSWFALLPFFVDYNGKKWRISWKELAQWSVYFFITSILFFVGRQHSLHSVLVSNGADDPWRIPKLFAMFMGSPLVVNNPNAALRIGGAMCMIFVLCTLWIAWKAKHQYTSARPWISFFLFAVLCSATIAPYRMSASGVLSSRYIAFSSFGVIGVIYLVQILQRRLAIRAILVLCWLILAFHVILNGTRWYPQMQKDRAYFDRGKYCLQWYETAPTECLDTIHFDGSIVREHAPILEEMGILR